MSKSKYPGWTGVDIRYGKFKGRTMFEIAQEDPEYLEFIMLTSNSEFVRKAALVTFKEHYGIPFGEKFRDIRGGEPGEDRPPADQAPAKPAAKKTYTKKRSSVIIDPPTPGAEEIGEEDIPF